MFHKIVRSSTKKSSPTDTKLDKKSKSEAKVSTKELKKAKPTTQGLLDTLLANIEQHERHITSSFDLVASNSCVSPMVRQIMGSALVNSYCIGLPGARFYGGCFEIDTIELQTRQVVCDVYGAKYCEIQLLSGMMANIAAYNVCIPGSGCTVMSSPSKNGGHYSHNVGGPLTRLFGANVVQTPWDEDTYNVDLEALPLAMATHKPVLLILGWSEMLFEHNLPAIRKICDKYDCKLMYDMSHVAGLIAGGVFQKDMMKYADIVTSSTGKSLHSADHGMVLYNDPSYTPKIRETVMPLLTSNTHFHETAAFCMALLEMKEYGKDYAEQVVSNTQALAREMVEYNFKLLCPHLGYSKTHELIVDLEGGSAAQATKLLDTAGIFVNPQDLPHDTLFTGATGLRLGTQVLTRRGYKECDMAAVAKALDDMLHKSEYASVVCADVLDKSTCFTGVSYTFDMNNNDNDARSSTSTVSSTSVSDLDVSDSEESC